MINSGLDPIVITLTDELMLYVMAVISEDISCYTDLVAISLILIVKIFFFLIIKILKVKLYRKRV